MNALKSSLIALSVVPVLASAGGYPVAPQPGDLPPGVSQALTALEDLTWTVREGDTIMGGDGWEVNCTDYPKRCADAAEDTFNPPNDTGGNGNGNGTGNGANPGTPTATPSEPPKKGGGIFKKLFGKK